MKINSIGSNARDLDNLSIKERAKLRKSSYIKIIIAIIFWALFMLVMYYCI